MKVDCIAKQGEFNILFPLLVKALKILAVGYAVRVRNFDVYFLQLSA